MVVIRGQKVDWAINEVRQHRFIDDVDDELAGARDIRSWVFLLAGPVVVIGINLHPHGHKWWIFTHLVEGTERRRVHRPVGIPSGCQRDGARNDGACNQLVSLFTRQVGEVKVHGSPANWSAVQSSPSRHREHEIRHIGNQQEHGRHDGPRTPHASSDRGERTASYCRHDE